ncbi:unnamed protein product [Staurois parvus]|uniref:Lasso RiPP family leader peptide-containing protein n=1 Tax=Staurois parvus TaxID=386267 RepID=A0ABN9D4S2_9NEOB|nr:unnamed protein product [Staurois parvus]
MKKKTERPYEMDQFFGTNTLEVILGQGRTDHLETRALPEGPGSVGGPMRCPCYLFHSFL